MPLLSSQSNPCRFPYLSKHSSILSTPSPHPLFPKHNSDLPNSSSDLVARSGTSLPLPRRCAKKLRCRAIEESIKETKCLIPPSPPPMDRIDIAGYSHSSIHRAVLSGDHAGLKNILASIPQISSLPQTLTEAESIAEESKADVISSFIDRRDVPNRETPLHLAIKISDASAVELLMAAGADCTLQNIHGWSSLHESICARDDKIAKIILWHYQISACIKWRRRLPRVVSAMNLMRDFYMEIEFHFESPLIPFISRLAPSDTYKIWKKGSNLRADMTISGFDGLRIKRSEKSVLFLGKGSEDGKVKPGSLCVISHKDKEVLNAMDGACDSFSDVELKQDVEDMRKTDVNRPGLDVTRATLHPQLTWRKKQRSEMVGPWKAKVYTMHHVVFSLKSRVAPGAINDDDDGEEDDDRLGELLTEEEKKKLELAFKMDFSVQSTSRDLKRNDLRQPVVVGKEEVRKVHEEGEFRKGLKPVLWLSSNFPLQTEEFLPLLDVLASKVKAVRRLRELLTTKLPRGTFPVKVAIPVIPTVRVLVSFTKFEELISAPKKKASHPRESPDAWAQWLISSYSADQSCQPKKASSPEKHGGPSSAQDPFAIPSNYRWTTSEAKKMKKLQQKKFQEANGGLFKKRHQG